MSHNGTKFIHVTKGAILATRELYVTVVTRGQMHARLARTTDALDQCVVFVKAVRHQLVPVPVVDAEVASDGQDIPYCVAEDKF